MINIIILYLETHKKLSSMIMHITLSQHSYFTQLSGQVLSSLCKCLRCGPEGVWRLRVNEA